jgi:hypothetical protein
VPGDPEPELLIAIIRRIGRGWRVLWRVAGLPERSYRGVALADVIAEVSEVAAERFRSDPASATAAFMLVISGRRVPVFDRGPQLIVAGEPGRLTATDVDDSVVHGATVEDLLLAAGVNPAVPCDYAVNWTRPVPALLAHVDAASQ